MMTTRDAAESVLIPVKFSRAIACTRLFLLLILGIGLNNHAAKGYPISIRFYPSFGTQGEYGWFYGFKDGSGFHLMSKGKEKDQWTSKSGASISKEDGHTVKMFSAKNTFPVCRWVSNGDGDVYLGYSLETIPEGMSVRMTISGKDVVLLPDRPPESPEVLHMGDNFHREVLRSSSWLGVKVSKGSIIDFSFDFGPDADPAAMPENCEVEMRIEFYAMDESAFNKDGLIARERMIEALKGPKSNEQLEKEAQAQMADIPLIAHKIYRCLASFPKDFSNQQGTNHWSYGYNDGGGFQLMESLETQAGFQWIADGGAAITAQHLTSVRNVLPVLRWESPVDGEMMAISKFEDEYLPVYITLNPSKGRATGTRGIANLQHTMSKGDTCDFGFEFPSPSEKADTNNYPQKFEVGAHVWILQKIEQNPPPPTSLYKFINAL